MNLQRLLALGLGLIVAEAVALLLGVIWLGLLFLFAACLLLGWVIGEIP